MAENKENQKDTPIIVQQLKVIGMLKDISPSAINPPDSLFKSNPEFAIDIKNMRFSPLEGSTIFDLVNERGNLKIDIIDKTISDYPSQVIPGTSFLDIQGIPIGIGIMNDELIIFTTETNGTSTTTTNENSLFYYDELKSELIDTALNISYNLVPTNKILEDVNSEISTSVDILLIDSNTGNSIALTGIGVTGELRGIITFDLSNKTYTDVIITSIKTFYKKDATGERLLFNGITAKFFSKDSDLLEDYEYKLQTRYLSDICNLPFPKYTAISQGFALGTLVEFFNNASTLPRMIILNGEITHYPVDSNDNYTFTNYKNYNSKYWVYLYTKFTNTWEILNTYPETLPIADLILLHYYQLIPVNSYPYFYSGEITLVDSDNTAEIVAVFDRTNNIGSLSPDESVIEYFEYTSILDTSTLIFNTPFTFKRIQVQIGAITEIFTTTTPEEIEHTTYRCVNSTPDIAKDGVFTIIINSLIN